MKIIQQTPADPASIEVNQPLFGDLNFNLARMKDTCSLEKVDLPGNQFNKATQVKQIAYSLWRAVGITMPKALFFGKSFIARKALVEVQEFGKVF